MPTSKHPLSADDTGVLKALKKSSGGLTVAQAHTAQYTLRGVAVPASTSATSVALEKLRKLGKVQRLTVQGRVVWQLV